MKKILEIEEDHFHTEETQRAVAQFFSGQKLISESESYGAEFRFIITGDIFVCILIGSITPDKGIYRG